MNIRTGACFIVCVSFSPSFLLFKVRLSKLQKTKTYQHVADPAAKPLRDQKKKKKKVVGKVQTRKWIKLASFECH